MSFGPSGRAAGAGADHQIERHGPIAILRMAKPPANAIDPAFIDGLHEALRELAADPPDALVFTGEGGFFSGGLDLKVVPRLNPDEQRTMLDRVNELGRPLFGFPRPVVSAVNGHAIAAGFVLALAGDYRIASRDGNYGLTEVRAGMSFPAGALAAIQAELPPQSARKLVLESELIDAATAVRLGAFDEEVERDRVMPRAFEVATKLAEHPTEVYARSKLALRAAMFASAETLTKNGDPLGGEWMLDESSEAARTVLEGGST